VNVQSAVKMELDLAKKAENVSPADSLRNESNVAVEVGQEEQASLPSNRFKHWSASSL
jgi:hypothetical protein